MDVNYGGKPKHKSHKIFNKSKISPKNYKCKNPWEPSEKIYKESKIFKLKKYCNHKHLKFVCDQMNKMLPKAFLLIKPGNIFIIPEETPLMFCK